MKSLLLMLYAVAVTALSIYGYHRHRTEVARLTQNQSILASRATLYRNQLDEASASAQALRLRCAEFEELRARDAERIRQLGIRLRRVEALSTTVSTTQLDLRTPLLQDPAPTDSTALPLAPSIPHRLSTDSIRRFRWHDPWHTVEGIVTADSVLCRVTGIDTLRQVVHRIPHRFLFFRWGTKALRQEISSSNPHTHLVYTEYIRLER